MAVAPSHGVLGGHQEALVPCLHKVCRGSASSYGRPKGTGKDDTRELRAVAEMMARDSALHPMTAMKKLGRGQNESAVRRLMVKRRGDGQALLAEAEHRERDAAQQQAIAAFRSGIDDAFSKFAETAMAMAPIMRRLGDEFASINLSPEFQDAILRMPRFELDPVLADAISRVHLDIEPTFLELATRLGCSLDERWLAAVQPEVPRSCRSGAFVPSVPRVVRQNSAQHEHGSVPSHGND